MPVAAIHNALCPFINQIHGGGYALWRHGVLYACCCHTQLIVPFHKPNTWWGLRLVEAWWVVCMLLPYTAHCALSYTKSMAGATPCGGMVFCTRELQGGESAHAHLCAFVRIRAFRKFVCNVRICAHLCAFVRTNFAIFAHFSRRARKLCVSLNGARRQR